MKTQIERAEPIRGAPPSGHTPDCCLDLDHKGDCKRWMKLPPNPAYPHFKEVHVQDDWCPKAGCRPASQCEIDAYLGAAKTPTPLTENEKLRAGHVVLLEALRRLAKTTRNCLVQFRDFADDKTSDTALLHSSGELGSALVEAEAAIQQAERT